MLIVICLSSRKACSCFQTRVKNLSSYFVIASCIVQIAWLVRPYQQHHDLVDWKSCDTVPMPSFTPLTNFFLIWCSAYLLQQSLTKTAAEHPWDQKWEKPSCQREVSPDCLLCHLREVLLSTSFIFVFIFVIFFFSLSLPCSSPLSFSCSCLLPYFFLLSSWS